jgi:uncharacterized protein YdiU (UPF0061 family)
MSKLETTKEVSRRNKTRHKTYKSDILMNPLFELLFEGEVDTFHEIFPHYLDVNQNERNANLEVMKEFQNFNAIQRYKDFFRSFSSSRVTPKSMAY